MDLGVKIDGQLTKPDVLVLQNLIADIRNSSAETEPPQANGKDPLEKGLSM